MGIYETINELEKLRKKSNMKLGTVLIFIIGMVVLFGSAGGYDGTGPSSTLIIFIWMGSMLAWSMYARKNSLKFKRLYKDTFVVSVLKELFPDMVYSFEQGFTKQQVEQFGLTKLGNRFRSEDYLTGTYKGVRFEQADVVIEYHTSGKNSHTTTYFNGRMFSFDVSDKVVKSVKVYSDNYGYRATNQFKVNEINMESTEFNKAFDIFSFDELEAFYVLTPPMMERIEELKRIYHSVAVHFIGQKLFVGIQTYSSAFDGSPGRKIDYMQEKEIVAKEAKVIMDIIDTLAISDDKPIN